jgi:hypothetical protein
MCAIDGCDSRVIARGWCDNHYRRWKRHGDPLGGRTPPGETHRYLRDVVLAYDGDECLIWPYSRTAKGYALIYDGENNAVVSRLVCDAVHGAPPTLMHDAAHSCGKGHEGCVTKRHLSWKTRAENCADKLVHGTEQRGSRNGAAKLGEPAVREILALKGKWSQSEIAGMYGVSQTAISHIHRGRSWGWLA